MQFTFENAQIKYKVKMFVENISFHIGIKWLLKIAPFSFLLAFYSRTNKKIKIK